MSMRAYIDTLRLGHPMVFDEALSIFGHHAVWLHLLESTPQDALWHAEGNVAVHTKMVLEELETWLKTQEQGASDWATVLRLSALFHDVAKPRTTTTKERAGRIRIVAPRHAQVGGTYFGHCMAGADLGLSVTQVRAVQALVTCHHEPKEWVIKNKPVGSYRALSRRADVQGLYALELADMRGRMCEDQEDQIDYIELFRLGCQEAGVWDDDASVYTPFVTCIADGLDSSSEEARERAIMEGVWDMESGQIFTPQEAIARSYASRDVELVVTYGISGSGKTTWVKEHYPDHAYVGLDALREEIAGHASNQKMNGQVRQLAKKRLKLHLGQKQNVVFDATNLRRDFRDAALKLGRNYGAHTTLLIMHTSIDTCRQRNKARSRRVDEAVMQYQVEGAQWPALDEAHRTLWVDASGEVVWDSRNWWQTLSA